MANFFGKGKTQTTPVRPTIKAAGTPCEASTSTLVQPDYKRVFHPFALKKDAELAPVNWFRGPQFYRLREHQLDGKNIIVIDDDEQQKDEDVFMVPSESAADLSHVPTAERLHNTLTDLIPSRNNRPLPKRSSSGLKTTPPVAVRTILAELNEAEVAGDDQAVRSLLNLLQDRKAIPAKVLIFKDDARPGYYGTWTRSSREVGPRTPFAKDVVAMDYTYDSGEEWEEESGDADDVVENQEEEDGDDEEVDSDLDSWLVDDDEVEEPGTPIEDRSGSPGFPYNLPVPPPPKRKAADSDPAKTSKKRKVVIPLVAFTKGPCWESTVGSCPYEPFKPYRIELLNDTPLSIDPFSFVSTEVDESHLSAPVASGSKAASDVTFVVPALPSRLTNSGGQIVAPKGDPSAPLPKKTQVIVPKTAFPEAHLPVLISKIQTLETGTISAIVEAVFHELKAHKVKKNSIEAKVKEIAEKAKDSDKGKIWVLKPGVSIPNVQ